jgi:hypothetical protein
VRELTSPADPGYPILGRLPDGVCESEVVEFLTNLTAITNTLGSVLTLGQLLGMKTWPLTPTRKVMKRELEAAALKHLGEGGALSGYAVGLTRFADRGN